jgi:hypothetical protein
MADKGPYKTHIVPASGMSRPVNVLISKFQFAICDMQPMNLTLKFGEILQFIDTPGALPLWLPMLEMN